MPKQQILEMWFICDRCGKERDRGIPVRKDTKIVMVCVDCMNKKKER